METYNFRNVKISKNIAFLLFALFVSGLTQYFILAPPDDDTAYHVAVGRLIAEHGILHSFPWTPFSWLSTHYGDKELLFHLLFVPLAKVDWILASKIVGTICGAAFLWAMYFILERQKVRTAWLWAVTPFAASFLFIFRFALTRPFLLSVALAAVILWAAHQKRYLALIVAAALYPWLYVAFWQLPLMMLVIAETGRFLSIRRISVKPAAVVFSTIILSVLIHPNGRELFMTSWVNMTEAFVKNTLIGRPENLEMGEELFPFSPVQWLYWMVPAIAMMIISACLCRKDRKDNGTAITFVLATFAFFIFTLETRKFADYLITFSVLSLALVSYRVEWKWFPHSVFLVSLIISLLNPGRQEPVKAFTTEEGLAETIWPYLQEQIPVGSQVFTTEWDYTGSLMLALPDRKFIVALDPTFFSKQNPRLYDEWLYIIRAAPENSADLIRHDFHSRFVMGLNFADRAPFFNGLVSQPGVKVLLYGKWLLFDLNPNQ